MNTISWPLGTSAITAPRFLWHLPRPVMLGLVMALVLAGNRAGAQTSGDPSEWTHLTATPANKITAERWVQPLRGEIFQLEPAVLHAKLATVARGELFAMGAAGHPMTIPMPDGTLARFSVVEAPVMEPELAAKFPEIKTYAGQGIDDPSATLRMDITPAGFHAQILSPNGTVYVDPAYRGDANLHVSYYKRDLVKPFNDFKCAVDGDEIANKAGAGTGPTLNKVQSGATLRTYRLAVACTGEYAAEFGGTVSGAMAAIIAAVNRVNGVYETELAVRLVLIANNDLLVYTNAATDPYTDDGSSVILGENQTNVTTVIGSANYDIGHVFGAAGGGVATLGCVCSSTAKARGMTSSSNPTGDAFWIDYVAHEMGHQFGGRHTFNSDSAVNCNTGTRSPSTAFEPGSGSTIMAYAGICSPDNLQPNSDPYFHAGSLDEIQNFLNGSGGGCAVTTPTGNNAPNVSVVGPTNYTIPAATPFVLTATGNDPNGHPVTYSWEQMDAGTAAALNTPDNGSMALFRFLTPTSSPVRYFPKLSSILANTNWNQEKLPTTSRTMKFRVTARDNQAGGGGVADADMTVTSVAGTGPFVVTSPNTATNWSGVRTVTWNVAGTAGAPINASGVNLYLSTNGGLNFQFLLATNVANSGSATVILPNLTTSQARVKVEGAGNIFFDISDANFSITPGAAAPLVQLAGTMLVAESCTPTNGAIDPYETVTVRWMMNNIGSAPTTNLVATLLTSNGVFYPSAALSLGAIPAGGSVTQAFSFIPVGVCGGSVTGLVKLVDGAADMGTLSQAFTLGAIQSTVSTQIFQNLSFVTIPSSGAASPYPSGITVSGVTNPVTKVTASLNGLSHTYPDDIDILLVNPSSQTVMLLSACGADISVVGANLTFDDAAVGYLPASTSVSPIVSGTFRPSGYDIDEVLPAPAPIGPFGTTLNPLAASPNGQWNLFLYDRFTGDSGSISGGWSLTFVTSNAVPICCNSYPAPTLTSTTVSNSAIYFSWATLPGLQYQVQTRTNLALGSWANYGSPFAGTGGLITTNNLASGDPARFYRVVVGP